MVGSVQSSTGSTAYTRGAQLGSGSSASSSRRSSVEAPPAESNRAEREETVRSTDSKESVTRAAPTTELSTRNDDQTISREQTRGSLLDIAV